jgi:translation initiation factor 2 beta subunit (eIF-2beta)/eIF-5
LLTITYSQIMGQQLILKQKHQQQTVSQILRTYGKQFRQISEMYSDLT